MLVDMLLSKSCIVYTSDVGVGGSGASAILPFHRREEVLASLRGALTELLALLGVQFDVWARQVVWQRLRLPKSIRPPEWVETGDGGRGDVDLNATAIVFDLDSSTLLPGEQNDLVLNTTIVSVRSLIICFFLFHTSCVVTVLFISPRGALASDWCCFRASHFSSVSDACHSLSIVKYTFLIHGNLPLIC